MQSNFVYANKVHSECCLVSISSINDLFSVDFVTTLLSSPQTSRLTVGKEIQTLNYNVKKGFGQNPTHQRNVTSALAPSVKHFLRSRPCDGLPKITHRLKGGKRSRWGGLKQSQLNTDEHYNAANSSFQHKNEFSCRFSSPETIIDESHCLMSRKEYLCIKSAFREMEEEVHNFDMKFSEYLNGSNYKGNSPKLKSLVITMLCTSQEKFDEMITKYYSTQGSCSNSKYQERFRKRLRELYRLIQISKTHGFIGLTSINHTALSDQVRGRRGSKEGGKTATLPESCSKSPEKILGVSKLTEELEKSFAELKGINDRIFSGVQCIHAQCPSAPKSKESHLICVQLGLKVAERLITASNYKSARRAFVTWRLDSQLHYNKLKVQKFKRIFAQSLFYRILSSKRAQILKQRIKIWRIFTKIKCKEERVLSSLMIQRAWIAFVHRQYMKMIHLVKTDVAIFLQREARRFMAMQRFERLKRDTKAAVIMQAVIRMSLSKNILVKTRRQWVLSRRLNSALLLQKVLRRYMALCKKYALRAISKAVIIQCIWRRYVDRKEFIVVKSAITVQKWVRRLLSIKERKKRKLIFVLIIQCAVRAYAARCMRTRKRRSNAAGKIQNFMVLALAKRKLRRKVEYKAARVVQKCMRRYNFKVLRLRIESSSIAIQNMLRVRNARIRFKTLKEEKIHAELLLRQKRKQLLQLMLIVHFNPSYV